MSTEANKAIIRCLFEEAFGQGNLAVLDEITAPNQVNGSPGSLPGIPSGPEGTKMLITAYRNAFPDLHFTIDEQIAEGNTS
jgi:predicted ester cyclase